MERQMVRYAISVVLEVICLLAIGALFLTPQILNPRTTDFTFTIFGICAVLMFNALRFEPRKTLLYLTLIATFIALILGFKNSNVVAMIRNVLWFCFIGGSTYLISRILGSHAARNSKILAVIVWTVSFALVYLVMTFLNIFVFGFYHIGFLFEGAKINAMWYFVRAIEIGGLLGFGIALGFIAAALVEKGMHATHPA